MKRITAKQLQLNLSKVVREVSDGEVYQVTFHGKPVVKLEPINKPQRGSWEAIQEALSYTINDPKLSTMTWEDDKRIWHEHLDEKYGSKS